MHPLDFLLLWYFMKFFHTTHYLSMWRHGTFFSPEVMNINVLTALLWVIISESVKVITGSGKKCIGCVLLNPQGHFSYSCSLFFLKTYCCLFPSAWLLLLWDKGRGTVEFRTDKSHHTSISQRVLSSLRQPASCSWLPRCSNILFFLKMMRLSSKS